MRLRSTLATVVAAVTAVCLLATSPAVAHEQRAFDKQRPPTHVGNLEAALKGAIVGKVNFAAAQPGKPEVVPFRGTLTNLPVDPLVSYPSPTAACEPESCAELQVTVPAGMKTLYGTIGWPQQNYYFSLYALSPDKKIHGRVDDASAVDSDYTAEEVDDRYTKDIGNERTIPRAQFTIADPVPGTWIIRARAIFANKTPFEGAVGVSADPPVELARKNTRQLADEHLTQPLRVNVAFAGRTLTKDQVAAMRAQLPTQYRPAVISKAFADCTSDDNDVDCQAGTLLNWHGAHYSGTQRSKDDKGDTAGGRVPFFEAMRFTYDYRFYEADDTWTGDLFGYMKSITKQDQSLSPTAGRRPGAATVLSSYNANRGIPFRGPDAQVTNTSVADKMDPWLIEDWIHNNRNDAKYAHSFKDLESGEKRDAKFLNPDPNSYYDPYYTAKGKKDLNRMPHGPATSVTYLVMDTFTSKLARQNFRVNTYHSFDVTSHMIDPDTKEPDAPEDMRAWGGRYRLFFLDLGAMPNGYESLDSFTNNTQPVTDSASYPDGDPPIWEIKNNPQWDGENTLVEKVARDVKATMFHRFTASYLYRPIPADVYFVANNNWSDFYSRPAPEGGGGVSYTDLTKIYNPDYVEGNLSSILPGATFTTERSDSKLKTFRYLGCSNERAGSSSTAVGAPTILIPDPSCPQSDKYQHALEEAKAQGDDVAGAGVQGGGVAAGVVRRFVEQNREEIAPLRPNQLTVTNISVVFPGAMTWTIPVIVGGIAFGTPNNEAWGVLQNVNDRFKPASATDCSKSPSAPECAGAPAPTQNPGSGFSYTIAHEGSHFLGLTHPHDSVTVEKNEEGEWDYYKDEWVSVVDFAQAPTTYAGAFVPYSVIDQDIVQRGHSAEYLRMAQDLLADSYLQDGMAGRRGPSAETQKKQSETAKWQSLGARLFACGDYLHAEYANRNGFLTAQGVYGPLVEPRQLQPGEKVLFKVEPQAAYSPDGGALKGCAAVAGAGLAAGELPATGGTGVPVVAVFLLAGAAYLVRRRFFVAS